jgi:phosphohistidine phosphatase
MRRLLLFRHAEAVHSSKYSDRERPLTAAGRLHAARIGAALADRGETVDLALVSDSLRTRETLELALAAYGQESGKLSMPDRKLAREIRFETALYHAERRDLMSTLRALPNSIETFMIVGHNPAIAEFAAQFAGSGDAEGLSRLALGFPPGALAIFDCEGEWRQTRWGHGDLKHFLI